MPPDARRSGATGAVVRIVAFACSALGALACLLLWPARLDADAHEHATQRSREAVPTTAGGGAAAGAAGRQLRAALPLTVDRRGDTTVAIDLTRSPAPADGRLTPAPPDARLTDAPTSPVAAGVGGGGGGRKRVTDWGYELQGSDEFWDQVNMECKGVDGVVGEYTMEEFMQHGDKDDDLWLLMRGWVLDVSKFAPNHPGGMTAIFSGKKRDASELFEQHHQPFIAGMQGNFCIGKLVAAGAKRAQPAATPQPTPAPAPVPEPVPPKRYACVDTHADKSQCRIWAGNNECVRNPGGMLEICRKTCNACTEEKVQEIHAAAKAEKQRVARLAEENAAWRKGGDKNGQRWWPIFTEEEKAARQEKIKNAKTKFDWYGLPVPDMPALERVEHKSIRSDYNFSKYVNNPYDVLPAYAYGKEPAFRYSPPMDQLYITLATTPRLLYFPNFMTMEECDKAVALASRSLHRSQVAITAEGRAKGESSTQEVRSSRSGYITLSKSNGLQGIEERMANITGVRPGNHEPIGVLNYQVGQHYEAHTDYFDPSMYGEGQTTNRFATFFLFFNSPEQGGYTTIPRANGGPYPKEFKVAACQMGLQVLPKKGSALIFYDMRPDRSLDPFSLHGGCDVEKGEKWAGPVWFRADTPAGTGHSHE